MAIPPLLVNRQPRETFGIALAGCYPLIVNSGLDNGVHLSRKWLITSIDGTHSVGQDIQFPENFSIQFIFDAALNLSKAGYIDNNIQSKKQVNYFGSTQKREGIVYSNIRLADSEGRNYKISWSIDCRWLHTQLDHFWSNKDARDIRYHHLFILPDKGENEISDEKYYGTLRIDKRGNTIKILVNGQLAISGNVAGYGPFVRFELDVSKTGNESLSLTDFRIEALDAGVITN